MGKRRERTEEEQEKVDEKTEEEEEKHKGSRVLMCVVVGGCGWGEEGVVSVLGVWSDPLESTMKRTVDS